MNEPSMTTVPTAEDFRRQLAKLRDAHARFADRHDDDATTRAVDDEHDAQHALSAMVAAVVGACPDCYPKPDELPESPSDPMTAIAVSIGGRLVVVGPCIACDSPAVVVVEPDRVVTLQ